MKEIEGNVGRENVVTLRKIHFPVCDRCFGGRCGGNIEIGCGSRFDNWRRPVRSAVGGHQNQADHQHVPLDQLHHVTRL